MAAIRATAKGHLQHRGTQQDSQAAPGSGDCSRDPVEVLVELGGEQTDCTVIVLVSLCPAPCL